MHLVKQATHIGDYRVKLTFEDGSVKVADLGPHLDGEVFEPLKDIHYFGTLRVDPDTDTIVWDNGADLSPDFLYEIGTAVSTAA